MEQLSKLGHFISVGRKDFGGDGADVHEALHEGRQAAWEKQSISLLRDQLGHKATGTVNTGDAFSSPFYLVLHNTHCSPGRSNFSLPKPLKITASVHTTNPHGIIYLFPLTFRTSQFPQDGQCPSPGGKHIASPFIWVTEQNPHQIATTHP